MRLYAPLSYLDIHALIRLSLRLKHIAFFLWTTNLEAVSILLLLLMCIYPLTPRPTNVHIQLPRFPLPRFQRPRGKHLQPILMKLDIWNYIPHAKSHFDPKTSLLWAKSQFATVLMSFFLLLFFGTLSYIWDPIRLLDPDCHQTDVS